MLRYHGFLKSMKKVVFITGISSGFGKSISSLLAQKQGYTVYGTCRSACGADSKIRVLQLDVTDRDGVRRCINQVLESEGKIDVLINNAGMHTGGPLEMIPDDLARLQMETNFMGPVHLVKAVLPSMRRRKEGTIINITSIGGVMGLPFQGYYSAAKFALEGWSEALRMELRPFNIKVIVIEPGDFHTRNTANRINIYKAGGDDSYEAQFAKTLDVIRKDENGGWHPDKLALKIADILEKKNPAEKYIVASVSQKLAVALKRILPQKWFDAILRGHYAIK
jgi:NAD(P)-dependent dehydrogenase (short-subunit alcohol dehydrogenase family)